MKLLTLEFGYFAHCGSTLTLPTHRYHNNRGLWCCWRADCQDLGRVGHICWCHSGNLYAFGHVICNTPATLVGVSPWHCLSMVVIFTSSCWICYSYSPGGGTVKWQILGWLMVPWEIMLCSWVFQFAEPQCHDGLDNLPLFLSNSTFHDFKLCCGSMWILCKSTF
jgi:hypothetical protein